MTDYTKTTNFAAKDSLPSGNANKIVKGAEIDTEFNNIATASATKANIAGPTFTGTVTIPTADINGGAVDGTTIGASSASSIVHIQYDLESCCLFYSQIGHHLLSYR